MSLSVHLDHVSKRFRIAPQNEYGRLTEAIASSIRSLFQNSSPSSTNQADDQRFQRGWFWALQDIDMKISSGEIVGIVGRNGAGKSTLLKLLARIIHPTNGRVGVGGRVGSLLEVGTGFHHELTGRENVFLNGSILGMSRQDIRERFDEIVAFAEVEPFLDMPVKRYSSGMAVRLAFSVAAHLEPDVLIVDEVLAVGDQAFQQKCMGKASELREQGRTILLVSHNLVSVANLCTRAVLLKEGRLVEDGKPDAIIERYLRESIGTEGTKTWPSETAPQTEEYLLREVAVHSETLGQPASSEVDIDRDILIRIEFEILRDGTKATPSIRLKDDSAATVFWTTNANSMNTRVDSCFEKELARGRYRSICRIPANFLNDRRYFVSVGIGAVPGSPAIHEESAISFLVHDTGAMRKEYSGPWLGPTVRLRFEWTTETVDSKSALRNDNRE